jgi:rhodanese-related sulfurtransferase
MATKPNKQNKSTKSIKASTSKAKPAVRQARRSSKNQPWVIGGILLALVVVVAGIFFFNNQTAVLPAEISVAQAYQKYQDGAFLLDVRTQEEWDEYHAPNTTLIPLDQLSQRVNELPKDQEIVVVCRSGNRSQEGRDILLNAGFEEVTSMAGGLSSWRTAGYPIQP